MSGAAPSRPGTPRVSVVVVSRGRPAALRRCLMALERQSHRDFEVIVVADAAGCAAAEAFDCRIRLFEPANISAARNAGIALAAAGIVAFIDDDAAAEPGWLDELLRPFADPQTAGAGGFVLGRNGISWQWRGRQMDRTGRSWPLEVPQGWSCPEPGPGRAARVEGTNMAFRREILAEAGGFDPGFAFFHDETDLCWRLHLSGKRLAVVPGAVVHHGVLASERRRADRMPRDLSDIGRSTALFLRRHAPDSLSPARTALMDEQRRRLLAHMRAGRCMPADVGRLLAGLDAGFRAGSQATSAAGPGAAPAATQGAGAAAPRLPPLPPADPAGFRPFVTGPAPDSVLVAGPVWRAGRLRAKARGLAAAGNSVTLLILWPTARHHRTQFGDDGVWLQSGGLFGRSLRQGPVFRFWRLAGRIAAERARLQPLRGFDGGAGSRLS